MATGEPLDVAVVGGGVSGLYAAWRLLNPGPGDSHWRAAGDGAPQVIVFEVSKRLGGRLLSPTPPGIPNLRAELGGMRFMSSQPLVSGLVKLLDLAADDLAADEPDNIVYLRNTHLRERELADSSKVPYQLDYFEQGVSPVGLTGRALEQVIPRIFEMDADELTHMVETRKIDGAYLWEWGFWNLLSLALSHEGFRFAQKGTGYDTALHNWNAADTIIMNAEFSPDAKYFRLRDGYEALPYRLADELVASGGSIERGHRLVSFDTTTLADGTVGVAMVFDAPDESGALVEHTVEARSLILAMPRRSIELLDQTGALLGPDNPEVHELLRSVTPNPLFVAALCYDEPWWEAGAAPGQSIPFQGRAITDLPIRQCYYWGVERDQPGGEMDDNALLLIYDDGQNVDFWAGFRSEQSRVASMLAGDDGHAQWSDFEAPPNMITELHRQIVELHDVRSAPFPYAAAWFDWGEDPYGGGVNFWKPGAKSWELIPRVAHPRPELPVFIVGEAYSKAQGWVEGALQTAELVLQGSYFGLGAPTFPSAADTGGEKPAAEPAR